MTFSLLLILKILRFIFSLLMLFFYFSELFYFLNNNATGGFCLSLIFVQLLISEWFFFSLNEFLFFLLMKNSKLEYCCVFFKYQTCFFFLFRDKKHTPSPSSVFDDFENNWLDLAHLPFWTRSIPRSILTVLKLEKTEPPRLLQRKLPKVRPLLLPLCLPRP